MSRRPLSFLLFLAAFAPSAAAQAEAWLQVRTPHFTVVSNAPEKDARRVSRQFERMQAVLVRVFPEAGLDSAAPESARAYGRPIVAGFTVNMTFKLFGDSDKILDLSQKARAGDASAEFELANDFFTGHGIPKDESQGLALLER